MYVCMWVDITEMYVIDSDSETVISVISASSESVVVFETVKIVKDIDEKKKKRYILKKENKKP